MRNRAEIKGDAEMGNENIAEKKLLCEKCVYYYLKEIEYYSNALEKAARAKKGKK